MLCERMEGWKDEKGSVKDKVFKMRPTRELPSGLVVRIGGFHCWGPGSVPGWGTGILQASGCKEAPLWGR